MGLFDKVSELKQSKDEPATQVIRDDAGKRRSKSWGSDATAHFKKMAEQSKKDKIARKMNSVLGDDNYKYMRKGGKTVGYERN